MNFLTGFNMAVSVLFMIFYSYQMLYIIVPFFKKQKTTPAIQDKKYAVLICARNEQNVIGQLIDSIKAQDYPKDKVTVFVLADNCTDTTAATARRAGAVVYERFDKTFVGKGYAMEALLENIKRDWGEHAFDGYFVFDADNILAEDFIGRMNDVFCRGYDIVTGYRNSKNWGENWISAGYGLWFLRESEYLNHSRHLMGNSCAVGGTGFMFSNEIVKKQGGWPFHLLTEDIEFSIDNVLGGRKIGYCGTAQFFDEQPTKFSESYKQRLRWAKGYFQVFAKYGKTLIKKTIARENFSCFDMSMSIMPAAVLAMGSFVLNITLSLAGFLLGWDMSILMESCLMSLVNSYLMLFLVGGITVITQWKDIHTAWYKKVLYTFTFPLFMFTFIPIAICALFGNVTWQPIAHTQSASLATIKQGK